MLAAAQRLIQAGYDVEAQPVRGLINDARQLLGIDVPAEDRTSPVIQKIEDLLAVAAHKLDAAEVTPPLSLARST